MSDIALRKKKNASAQAAFRARRANYITTLEETVTNLEAVVLQLQASCRDSRNEAQDLRQQNITIKQAFRDRENLWRAMWPRKGENDDPQPPPLPSFLQPQASSEPIGHYSNDGMAYRVSSENMCAPQFPGGNAASMPSYIESDAERAQKYPPYFNAINASPRNSPWPHHSPSNGDSIPHNGSHSNSPHFVESPTVNSPIIAYGRYGGEDQKIPMNGLDTSNAYVFSASRSISPSSSTPPSSSFNTLTSPFQSNFADVHTDFRRQSSQVVLHGGTADISSLPSSNHDAVRYRLPTTRNNTDRSLLPILPPLSTSDNSNSPHEAGSDGDSSIYPVQRLRSRRGTISRHSRSPSPDSTPLSGTLAVIKAQAFGALRRTRTRSKKQDGSSKVSIDVLQSRGLDMGGQPPAKRQRLGDDLDLHS